MAQLVYATAIGAVMLAMAWVAAVLTDKHPEEDTTR